jgi:NAD(P)-dependent dehydrogenase (short-subunit alcohol dehydrogenase family)
MGTTLQGKRIVVLGGTGGIGFATAEAAARDGASLVIASSRQARVDTAVARLPAGTEGHAVDLSREAAIRDFFERVGAFDHLVYTAGESLNLGPIASTVVDEARAAYNIRFWGAYAAAKYAAPHIRPGGSIAIASGNAGARPQKGWTVAASMCGAIEALTRALAVELAPIRVNTVSAGIVRTDLWSPIPPAEREAMFEQFARGLPVGRVGEPADIAEAYVYLMRDGFTTGTVLTVDGGGVLA